MKVRIIGSDGISWHAAHIGEEFVVNLVTVHLGHNGTFVIYEVGLTDRHFDAIAGGVSDEFCTVTDWTGWPFGTART